MTEKTLVLCAGLGWCFERVCVVCRARLGKANFLQLGSQILACVRQFERLQLRRDEFVLLRCAILLNSGTPLQGIPVL